MIAGNPKLVAWWPRRASSAADELEHASMTEHARRGHRFISSGYPEAVSEGGRVGRVPRPSIAVVEIRHGHPFLNPGCPGSAGTVNWPRRAPSTTCVRPVLSAAGLLTDGPGGPILQPSNRRARARLHTSAAPGSVPDTRNDPPSLVDLHGRPPQRNPARPAIFQGINHPCSSGRVGRLRPWSRVVTSVSRGDSARPPFAPSTLTCGRPTRWESRLPAGSSAQPASRHQGAFVPPGRLEAGAPSTIEADLFHAASGPSSLTSSSGGGSGAAGTNEGGSIETGTDTETVKGPPGLEERLSQTAADPRL